MFLSGVKLIPDLFSLHLTLWPAGGISGHDPPRSLLPLRGGRLLWSFIAVVLLDDSWFKSHSREDAEIWRVAVFKDSHGHSQHIKRVLSYGFRVAKWNKTNNISAQKQVGSFTLQSVYSLQSTLEIQGDLTQAVWYQFVPTGTNHRSLLLSWIMIHEFMILPWPAYQSVLGPRDWLVIVIRERGFLRVAALGPYPMLQYTVPILCHCILSYSPYQSSCYWGYPRKLSWTAPFICRSRIAVIRLLSAARYWLQSVWSGWTFVLYCTYLFSIAKYLCVAQYYSLISRTKNEKKIKKGKQVARHCSIPYPDSWKCWCITFRVTQSSQIVVSFTN